MKKIDFDRIVEVAKKSKEYQNYLEVREAVFRMIDNEPKKGENIPSSYWQQELSGFEYLLDASPLLVQKLRHHAYHMTGVREYDYRKHHFREAPSLRAKLEVLKSKDPHNLLVPESPELGGFGYKIDGALYNIDTLRFYECLLALDKEDLLEQFRSGRSSGVILEIGSGWGGLAYQFKKLFPKVCYILIDFPLSLLFSATYIKTLFPDAKILIVDGSSDSFRVEPQVYDFIFLPHYGWENLIFRRPDLIINMASFQEMTTVQVENYLRKAKKWGIPYVYSWNRDHSPNNSELTTVSSILGKYYGVKEVKVLEGGSDTKTASLKSLIRSYLKSILRLIFPQRFANKNKPIHAYRYLLGTLP